MAGNGQHMTAADLFNLAAGGASATPTPGAPQAQATPQQGVMQSPGIHPILGIPIHTPEQPAQAQPSVDPLDQLMAALGTPPVASDPVPSSPAAQAPAQIAVPEATAAANPPSSPLQLIAQPAAAISTDANSGSASSLPGAGPYVNPSPPIPAPAKRHSVSSPVDTARDHIADTTSSNTKVAGRALNSSESQYTSMAPDDRLQFQVADITMYAYNNQQYRGNLIAASDHFILYAIRGAMLRAINMHTGHRLLLRGHSKMVTDVVCHPNRAASLFASVDEAGAVFVWRLDPETTATSSEPVFVAPPRSDGKVASFLRLQWHPTSEHQFIVTTSDNKVALYDFGSTGVNAANPQPAASFTPLSPSAAVSEIRSIAFSEASIAIACELDTGCGSIFVTSTSLDAKYCFTPTNLSGAQLSVDDLFFLNAQTLLVSAGNGSTIQVWAIDAATMNAACLRELSLTDNDHGVENVARLTDSKEFLILSNRLSKGVTIIHLLHEQLVFLSEFSLREPGLSVAPRVTSDDGEARLQLYCVQTKAIQTYSTATAQLLAPSGNVPATATATHHVALSTPPTPSPPADLPTDLPIPDAVEEEVVQDEEEVASPEVADEPVVDSTPGAPAVDGGADPLAALKSVLGVGGTGLDAIPAPPSHEPDFGSPAAPQPEPTMSDPVETPDGSVRIMQRGGQEKAKTADVPVAAPSAESPAAQETATAASGAAGSGKKKKEGVAKEKGEKAAHKVEQAILARVDKLMKHRFEKERQERNKEAARHQKELVKALNEMVQTQLHKEINKTVIPTVRKTVKDHLDSGVMKPVTDNLTKLLVQFNQGVVTNIGNAVKKPLNAAFQKQFNETIVPKFERSCQAMFAQLDTTLKAGLEHAIRPTVSELVTAQNATTTELIRLRDEVARLSARPPAAAAPVAQAPVPQQAYHQPPPQQQPPQQVDPVQAAIALSLNLARQNNHEEAFIKALSAANLNVVEAVINNVPTAVVRSLSQRVLLSLMQQLTSGFRRETGKKITWLLEVAVALDPAHADIRAHAFPVVQSLVQTLQSASDAASPEWQMLPDASKRELRALQLTAQGALQNAVRT